MANVLEQVHRLSKELASTRVKLDRLSKELQHLDQRLELCVWPTASLLSARRRVSLKGTLLGAKIHDGDIQAARRSLFSVTRTR